MAPRPETPLRGLSPLPESFFARDTAEVARDLIGCWLVHEGVGGPLVETEAYLGMDDPASHAFRGPTPRAAIMFEQVGRAYVYFSYGNHNCVNVVAHPEGKAGAVLLRALEPRIGVETMIERRQRSDHLAAGPGRLCQALGIDRGHNGVSLLSGPLTLQRGAESPPVSVSLRIGITKAKDAPLRFTHQGSRFVSR